LDAQSITTFVADGTTAISNDPGRRDLFVREGTLLRVEGPRLDLRDLAGHLVGRSYGSQDKAEIDLSGLRSGVYVAACAGQTESVVITP
jgi:hypothetical protein